MSRRKKRSEEPDRDATVGSRRDAASKAGGSRTSLSEAHPPKPSKPLLAMAIALLTAWLGFLLVMALTRGTWFALSGR